MISVVVSTLPMYLLSFYKAPTMVMYSIQRKTYDIGRGFHRSFRGRGPTPSWNSPLWFGDIGKLVRKGVDLTNWFSNEVVRRVGDETNTRFWKDNWLGHDNLMNSYSRLFNLSLSKDTLIDNPGRLLERKWE
ncbi:hypothetical protein Lal_00011341 [Lupinus albus]|nr:hypothetical protein Lal_00011341 [Lupinus albus]